MKKIYFLLMAVAAIFITSCDGGLEGNYPYPWYQMVFTLIDSESNFILEKEPEAINDIEIIYNGISYTAYNVSLHNIKILSGYASPRIFMLQGGALKRNSTVDFTFKFRGQSREISITSVENSETVTIDGKPAERVEIPYTPNHFATDEDRNKVYTSKVPAIYID